MQKVIKASHLLQTGWQSWSWQSYQHLLKFPACNFPPKPISYLDKSILLPKKNFSKPKAKGWCSWYAFAQNITEKIILNQARWFKKHHLPGFEYILIDDGWQSHWGDWLTADPKKFPQNLKWLAKKITDLNLKPGIWLAPFLIDPKSKLAADHPDWLVQHRGKFVNGHCQTPFELVFKNHKYILDYTQPAGKAYLKQTLDWLLGECNFKLIKLDFLYAPYFSPHLTNAQGDQTIRSVLKYIKKKYPDVHINTCGCPLIPVIGLTDSMRIGPDTIFPRLQKFPILKQLVNQFLISRVIRNLRNRHWTKIFWHLDGDVFICGHKFGLNQATVQKLQTALLNYSGNIFLGDDLTTLPAEKFKKFIKPMFN